MRAVAARFQIAGQPKWIRASRVRELQRKERQMPVTQTLPGDEDSVEHATNAPLTGLPLTAAQRAVVAVLRDRFCFN
jgi:hypothetical protein